MAEDAGTTRLTPKDLARATGSSEKVCIKSVERGRVKLAAWLKLIRDAEDVTIPVGACSECGEMNCGGGEGCDGRKASIEAMSREIPLAKAVDMSPPKWAALLRNGSLRTYYRKVIENEYSED